MSIFQLTWATSTLLHNLPPWTTTLLSLKVAFPIFSSWLILPINHTLLPWILHVQSLTALHSVTSTAYRRPRFLYSTPVTWLNRMMSGFNSPRHPYPGTASTLILFIGFGTLRVDHGLQPLAKHTASVKLQTDSFYYWYCP